MRSKFYTTIKDRNPLHGQMGREIRIEIKEGLAGYYIEVKPEGY